MTLILLLGITVLLGATERAEHTSDYHPEKEPQTCIDNYPSINCKGFLVLTDGEICSLGGLSEVWQ